jgi:uncharacterized membrane protein (UPF0127 family)
MIEGLSPRHALWLAVFLVGFVLVFLAFVPFVFKETTLPFALKHRSHEATAFIDGTPFRIHLLTTEFQRVKGLSGTQSLEPNEGMFFAFEKDGEWGIWMKDMLFSIDILWISKDGKVVKLMRDVSPDTYPTVFTNDAPARYVLELKSGATDAYNIEEGSVVTF